MYMYILCGFEIINSTRGCKDWLGELYIFYVHVKSHNFGSDDSLGAKNGRFITAINVVIR